MQLRAGILVRAEDDRLDKAKTDYALSAAVAGIGMLLDSDLQKALPTVALNLTARNPLLNSALQRSSTRLLRDRKIVVDHQEGARHEADDLLQAGLGWSRVRELAEVTPHGGGHASPVPVLKRVEHIAWNLAAARMALQSAV